MGENTVDDDLIEYTSSFGEELKSKTERFTKLIPNRHQPSDGGFHEWLVREQLRRALPSSIEVSSGFVFRPVQKKDGTRGRLISQQIDVLLWNKANHTVALDAGNFVVITPEACLGAIEITKSLDGSKLQNDLQKIDSVLKFGSLRKHIEGRLFTAVVGLTKGPKKNKTLLKHALEYYRTHNDQYWMHDDEEDFSNAKGLERQHYVDIVASLGHGDVYRTYSAERNPPYIFSYRYSDMPAAFAAFENFVRQYVTTNGRPARYQVTKGGAAAIRKFPETNLEHWSVLNDCAQVPAKDSDRIPNIYGHKTDDEVEAFLEKFFTLQ